MTSYYLTSIFLYLKEKLGFIVEGRFWILKSVIFCATVSLFFSFPRFERIFFNQKGNTGSLLMEQVQRPFDIGVFDGIDPGSHESKRVFRITVPLLANALHLNIFGIYFMQLIIGLLGLTAFLLITNQIFEDRFVSFLFLLSLTSTLIGKIWYLQYASYFDGISIAFLILAMLAPYSALTFLFSFFAFFNDERCLIGILPILLGKLLLVTKTKIYPVLAIIFAVLFYGIIRLLLQHFLNMKTPVGDHAGFSLSVLKSNLWSAQFSFLKIFEGFWILFAFASFLLWKFNKIHFGLWLLVLLVTLTASLTVQDVDRSLTYGAGMIIYSFLVIKKFMPDLNYINEWAILICLICVIVPTNSFIGNYYGIYASNFFLVELFRIVQALQGHIFQY